LASHGQSLLRIGDHLPRQSHPPKKSDPTNLQDAASIAGLLTTTEAVAAEKPKKETPVLAMPPGGGRNY